MLYAASGLLPAQSGRGPVYVPASDSPVGHCGQAEGPGVRNVVIKMGEEGVYCSPEKASRLRAVVTMKTVDTTGAGDAFVGGFIGALDDGNPLKPVWSGNSHGRICRPGGWGHSWNTDQEELLSFINSTERLEIKRE